MANVIAFGALNNSNTSGSGQLVGALGVREMLITQALCGMTWAFLAGQPLIVLQTTGPLSVMFSVLFGWSETLSVAFLPFYAWTGVWLSVLLVIIAVFDLSAWSRYCSLYTQEVFGMLVAVIFLYEACKWMVNEYTDDTTTVDVLLLQLIV
eukprot:m.380031 g.380031  ORF g.380031 m.380031 type:complete len:151 (+) comp20033_c0_seq6:1271-1723(+)